jgi:hypothetical protein
VKQILPSVLGHAEAVEMGRRIAPGLLGSQGDRRYGLVVADENDAKHPVGVLVASNGRLRIDPGPVTDPFAGGAETGERARGDSAGLDGSIMLRDGLLRSLLIAAGTAVPPDPIVMNETSAAEQRAISVVAAHIFASVARLGSSSAPVDREALDALRARRIDVLLARPEEQALVTRLVAGGR